MPELPEVETTLRGILPHIVHETIINVIIRHPQLRWPIPVNIKTILKNEMIQSVTRRGKYLLLQMTQGTVIIHLGMSGVLRILTPETPAGKHDHVDLIFANNKCLRLRDPRRFGAFLWTMEDPLAHPLLRQLGPEPFSQVFTADYLWQRAQKRQVAIKNFLMDSKTVVGVGNIYAAEVLFQAGIHPEVKASQVSLTQYEAVVAAIKKILKAAIKQGGTTLKDFVNSEGGKGYFSVHLSVYGRGKKPCLKCNTVLKEIRQGQRSTVFCPECQR